jgi:sugar O-acyltransferase (sialic acid O-acetyltransferase NeuD family)
MKTKLAIFGGPGSGEIVAQSVVGLDDRFEFIGYLNDGLPRGGKLLGGDVLGTFGQWSSLPDDVQFIAPLHKVGEMEARLEIISRLGLPDNRWATVIDRAAAVADNSTVSFGTAITCFALVGPSNRVGRLVAMWPGAQVGHDAQIGDFAFIGRNSIVSGYCTVGTGAFIGSGSVVRERCRVGRFAVVGAGTTVISDVPDYAIVAGRPARILRVAKHGSE